jgi:hypothetical protein
MPATHDPQSEPSLRPIIYGGLGRDGGLEAIKEYAQTRSIWICTKPDKGYAFAMK